MDVLSEVLRVVKLQGALFLKASFPHPGVSAQRYLPPSRSALPPAQDT